jgi:hypothetical protein
MKEEQRVHESFCVVYADAVVRFVTQGQNGDVVYDDKTKSFEWKAVAPGVPPSSCEWWVGEDWPSFVGPLKCPIDPQHPKFTDKALHGAIVLALTKSATGRRMSRILAGFD